MEYQEYRLSVWERLILSQVLPPAGTLTTMRIVRKLVDDLGFTEAEYADLQMKQDEAGTVRWKEGAIPNKAIEIGPKGVEIVRDAMGKFVLQLDEQKQLTLQHLDLAERFGWQEPEEDEPEEGESEAIE